MVAHATRASFVTGRRSFLSYLVPRVRSERAGVKRNGSFSVRLRIRKRLLLQVGLAGPEKRGVRRSGKGGCLEWFYLLISGISGVFLSLLY